MEKLHSYMGKDIKSLGKDELIDIINVLVNQENNRETGYKDIIYQSEINLRDRIISKLEYDKSRIYKMFTSPSFVSRLLTALRG